MIVERRTLPAASPWSPRGGVCCVCGEKIADYYSKWSHEDGRVACPEHYFWTRFGVRNEDDVNYWPPSGFGYYTDG